jgi:hypothetical protein
MNPKGPTTNYRNFWRSRDNLKERSPPGGRRRRRKSVFRLPRACVPLGLIAALPDVRDDVALVSLCEPPPGEELRHPFGWLVFCKG